MPSHRRHRRLAHRGFTLLELVIVMTIVALAAVLVVPNIARTYAHAELRWQARSAANLFLQARERAVYHAEPYLIVFSPAQSGPRTLYLAAEDGAVINKVTFPAGTVLRARQGEEEWTEDPPPVHFFSNGACQPLQLEIQGNDSARVRLQLDPLTGRLSAAQVSEGD